MEEKSIVKNKIVGSVFTGVKQEKRKPLPQWFKKGQSGNPNGRPLGGKNFMTEMDEAIAAIGKENKIKASEVKKKILMRVLSEALKGNFNYSKDLFDRYYGKPKEQIDVTSGGDKISLDKIAFSIDKIAKKEYEE